MGPDRRPSFADAVSCAATGVLAQDAVARIRFCWPIGCPAAPVPATRLWDLLREILGGKSRAAAARDCDPPFQYSTAHRFLNRLDLAQDRLRGLLCRLCPAPSGEGLANALCQCIEHLRRAFAAAACPITAFVLAFQQPFLE